MWGPTLPPDLLLLPSRGRCPGKLCCWWPRVSELCSWGSLLLHPKRRWVAAQGHTWPPLEPTLPQALGSRDRPLLHVPSCLPPERGCRCSWRNPVLTQRTGEQGRACGSALRSLARAPLCAPPWRCGEGLGEDVAQRGPGIGLSSPGTSGTKELGDRASCFQ